jgi:hypothetical protein
MRLKDPTDLPRFRSLNELMPDEPEEPIIWERITENIRSKWPEMPESMLAVGCFLLAWGVLGVAILVESGAISFVAAMIFVLGFVMLILEIKQHGW